jgi:hypothetical protein
MREKASLIILAIIFGSGFLVYFWNLAQGKDLSKPPEFDLSAFDIKIQRPYESDKSPAVPAESSVKDALPAPHEIFFRPSFRAMSAAETEKRVTDFLKDFLVLHAFKFEDFEAKNRIVVAFKPEFRNELLESLKTAPEILKFTEIGNNQLQIELKNKYYYDELKTVLPRYDALVVMTEFKNDTGFIGKLDYADKAGKEAELEEMAKDFSDLVEVK